MKKVNKIIVLFLMLALSIGSIFISPVLSVFAGTATVGAAITLSKIPTTGKIYRKIKIPLATTDASGSSVTLKITDPSNKLVHEINCATAVAGVNGISEDGKYFELEPKMLGDYKIQYVSNAVSPYFGINSEVYTLTVTGSKPVLSFSENTKYIIPQELGYSYLDGTTQKAYEIILPSPTVKDFSVAEEKEIELDLSTIKVSDLSSDQKTKLEAKTLEISELQSLLGYSVKVQDANYNDVTPTYTVTASEDGETYSVNYVISPVEDVFGTYSIVYGYTSNLGTGLKATERFTFEVSNHFDGKRDLTFTWNNGANIPTSAILGKEVELPTPAVTTKAGNKVKSYTEVSVFFVGKNDAQDQTKWKSVKVEDFKFTPKYESKNDGSYYLIKYKITDFFGNKIEKEYTFSNVSDTLAPTVYLVNDYTVSTEGDVKVADIGENIEEINNTIPTKVATGAEVVLPAIYATDNVSEYNDLTLTRTYRYESGDSIGFAAKTSEITNKVAIDENTYSLDNNVKAVFKPTKEGTYTFYYRATDKAGRTATPVEFTIEVKNDFVDSGKPEIKLPDLVDSVDINDTITFNAPTAVDYEDSAKTIVLNKNIKTKVGYYYVYEEDEINKEYVATDLTLKDGKYSVKAEKDATKTLKQVVLVFSSEDFANYDSTGTKNVEEVKHYIDVLNYEDDLTAPTTISFETAVEDYIEVEQKEDNKEIAPIVFADANDISVSISVTDPNGDGVSVSGMKYEYVSAGNVKVSGAKFDSYTAGKHIVRYTAKDANGNTQILAYEVNVKKSIVDPRIVVKNVPTEVEVGKEIILPTASVITKYENTVVVELLSLRVEYVNKTPDVATGNKFMSKTTGEYTFKYVAVIEVDGVSQTIESLSPYTIKVVDTKAPTITLENTTFNAVPLNYVADVNGRFVKVGDNFVAYDSSNEAHSTLTRYAYKDIEISGYTVSDTIVGEDDKIISSAGIKSESVVVKDASGKTLLESSLEDALISGSEFGYSSYFKFTPTGNGKYSITYTAIDVNGKTTTLTKELTVGDCTKPEIDLNNQEIETTAKIGDTLSINFNEINLSDVGSEDVKGKDGLNATNKDIKFTVTVETPKKETIEIKENTSSEENKNYTYNNGKLTFNFSEAGNYVITLTATDKAGNTDVIKKTVVVKSNASSSIISEQALGIILVCASVVLLAGVVVYFVISNKKYTLDNKNKK